MNHLLEAFKDLNKLYEAKADQEAFINKFGKDYFDLFNKFKGRLQSKNISTDMTWHVKHTSIEDMKEILDNFNSQRATDDKGKSKLNRKKIFEDSNFIVWEILDWETAMNMADGASWCIAGRYHTNEPKPSQAKQYFNDYLQTTYSNYYYVISKSNNRKWCICKRQQLITVEKTHRKEYPIDIWTQEDRAIATRSKGRGIEGLPTIEEISYYVDDYDDFVGKNKEYDPEKELVEDFLGTEAIYDESDGYWHSFDGVCVVQVDPIEDVKGCWLDTVRDWFENDEDTYYKNFNYDFCLDQNSIKTNLVYSALDNKIEEFGDDEISQMCCNDEYDSLDDFLDDESEVESVIRSVIIDYIWDNKTIQDDLGDVDYIRDEIRIRCHDFVDNLANQYNTTWLDVAEEVLGQDYLIERFNEWYEVLLYIDFDAYWNNMTYDIISEMYNYTDWQLSNDGQLLATSV